MSLPFRCTILLLGCSALASATPTLVNVDFNNGASATFAGTGILGGGTWNGVSTLPSASLVDSTGGSTGITVGISGSTATFTAAGAVAPAMQPLMADYRYYVDPTHAAAKTVTLSGLGANTTWNLVLFSGNGNQQGAEFTIGGVPKPASDAGTVGATLTEGDEYVRFNGITSNASGEIAITWRNSSTTQWTSFNGFQLESAVVAGPANISLPSSIAVTPDGSIQNYNVTVSNISADTALTVSGVSFLGGSSPAFSLVTPMPLNVPVSSSATLTFAFNPAGVSGTVNATMRVTSNDPDDSPKDVPINGYVADPVASPNPVSLDFGEVASTDAPSDMVADIYNDGWNNNLAISSAVISNASFAAPNASRFTLQTAPAASVPPGGVTPATVRFNPTGLTGRAVATLDLATNDPANPSRKLLLTGVTPMTAGALSDDFTTGYASSVWDNPWDATTFSGGKAEFNGAGANRKYLRTVASNFGNIDFTVTATLNRGNNTGGDGSAFFGLGSGVPNGSYYNEPSTGSCSFVRFRSKGWSTEFGDVIVNNTIGTGMGLSNSALPNAVDLRLAYTASTGTAVITLDADANGFDAADPKFTAVNPDLATGECRIFAGGAGGTSVDNVVVTLGVADPFGSWAAGWSNPALVDQTPEGDPDHDGLANLLEFVLGGDPRVSSASILPVQSFSGSDLVLSFLRQDAASAVPLTGQWSSDLATWHDVVPTLVNGNGSAPDSMEIRIPVANAVNGRLFGRLRATQP